MTLKGHTSMIQCVAVFSDQKRIVSGSLDRTLKIWHSETGQCLRTLRGHTGGVYCVAILPTYPISISNSGAVDDDRIVSGSDDNTLRIWESQTGRILQVLKGHTDTVSCVVTTSVEVPSTASSPMCASTTLMISGSWDKTLRVWQYPSASADSGVGVASCIRVLQGHSRQVHCLSLVPSSVGHSNAVILASGSWDRSIRIWDVLAGHCLAVLTGHSDYVLCLSALVVPLSYFDTIASTATTTTTNSSSDGEPIVHKDTSGYTYGVPVLVSGSIDRTIRFWRLDGVLSAPSTAFSNHHHPYHSSSNGTTTASSVASSSSSRSGSRSRSNSGSNLMYHSGGVGGGGQHFSQRPRKSHLYGEDATTNPNGTAPYNHHHQHRHACFHVHREPNAAIYCLAAYPFSIASTTPMEAPSSTVEAINFVSGSFYRALSLWQLDVTDTLPMVSTHSHSNHGSRFTSPTALHGHAHTTTTTNHAVPASILSPIRHRVATSAQQANRSASKISFATDTLATNDSQVSLTPVTAVTNTATVTEPCWSWRLRQRQSLEGHKGTASCVAVLADGRMVSGSRDETLLLWSPLL